QYPGRGRPRVRARRRLRLLARGLPPRGPRGRDLHRFELTLVSKTEYEPQGGSVSVGPTPGVGMRVGSVLRRLYIWKELLLALAIVLFNGVIVSNSGLLSYTHFTWAAFAQSYPLGQACVSASECQFGFCVDGVCCNQACSQPNQLCNAPGAPGICQNAATAP